MAERLCSLPNVVGIKESSGDMINVMNLIEMTMKVDSNFRILVGTEEIFLPILLMGGKGCMTATAGIMPEFMTGIYKAFMEGNTNLAYNLQFALLPLIREMKTVNFPQGFKEAMSLRGIEMGPPKMNYPPEAIAKISDLKERLRIEVNSLMETFYPTDLLTYRIEAKSSKYNYPTVCTGTPKGIKRYADCTLCGMCEGDYTLLKTTTYHSEKSSRQNLLL